MVRLPLGARSMVEPVWWIVPSGRVQVAIRSGGERQSPAAFVDEVMVLRADRRQIVEIRSTAVFPGDHVMDLTRLERHGAGRSDAGAVHRPQRRPLGWGRQPLRASDGECFAAAVEHDRDDLGLTRQTRARPRPAMGCRLRSRTPCWHAHPSASSSRSHSTISDATRSPPPPPLQAANRPRLRVVTRVSWRGRVGGAPGAASATPRSTRSGRGPGRARSACGASRSRDRSNA